MIRRPTRLLLALLLALSLATDASLARAAPSGQTPTVPPSAGPAGEPLPPTVRSRAAVVIEAASGRILFARDAHQRLPPASLTKMVTAMVALERASPDRPIVATANSMVEPSVIGLDPGDRLPLREALYGLLLNSGNDVALAIAETLGNGSIARFVDWMNVLVRSLGLENTRFANPHGLDIGEHYSTAYDMAIVGRVLMQNALLRAVVAERRRDYEGPPLWAFRNINRFLATYPGADGIKTGYEVRAGRCLAASASRDGRSVVAVVLNSEDYVADSAALIDYGFARLAYEDRQRSDQGTTRLEGDVGRLVSAATGRAAVPAADRPYLRSVLRSDLGGFGRDPSLVVPPRSAFERLRAAAISSPAGG